MGRLVRLIGFFIGILMLISATVAMIGCSTQNVITAPEPVAVPSVPTQYVPPVAPIPTVHNVILNEPGCGCAHLNHFITLMVSTNDPGPFYWDFGDGNYVTVPTYSVDHAYTSLGRLRLTVTTANGYSAGADLLVEP